MKTRKPFLLQLLAIASGILILFSATRCGFETKNQQASFQKAEPVWPVGREKEKNLTVGFLAQFDRPYPEGAEVFLSKPVYGGL